MGENEQRISYQKPSNVKNNKKKFLKDLVVKKQNNSYQFTFKNN